MSVDATQQDDHLLPGLLFLTGAQLQEVMAILGQSERFRGRHIGAEAFDKAGMDNLAVALEAAASIVAALVLETERRGSSPREQLALVELVSVRAGQILNEWMTKTEHGPVGHA
jgi:hypothetical protein